MSDVSRIKDILRDNHMHGNECGIYRAGEVRVCTCFLSEDDSPEPVEGTS